MHCLRTAVSYLAGDKEEARDVVPREVRLEAAAHLARHVLADILAQQRLDVLSRAGKTRQRKGTETWFRQQARTNGSDEQR